MKAPTATASLSLMGKNEMEIVSLSVGKSTEPSDVLKPAVCEAEWDNFRQVCGPDAANTNGWGDAIFGYLICREIAAVDDQLPPPPPPIPNGYL